MDLTVREFIDAFPQFELLTPHADLERVVTVPEISRPGIELTGYVENFPYYRVQMMGIQEIKYLASINYNQDIIEQFLSFPIPILIVCRGLEIDQTFFKCC